MLERGRGLERVSDREPGCKRGRERRMRERGRGRERERGREAVATTWTHMLPGLAAQDHRIIHSLTRLQPTAYSLQQLPSYAGG